MRRAGIGLVAMLALALGGCAETLPRGRPLLAAGTPAPSLASCRRVGDVVSQGGVAGFLRIEPDAAARMATIGLDRAQVFARMQETSIPETTGCWADPAGNFDGQLISVGTAQWNFGTGSLQPVLLRWRDGFANKRDFRRAVATLMPVYGSLIFSRGCLAVPVSAECRAGILAAEDARGTPNPELFAELTALFESDTMLQVQLDTYLALLDAVRVDLLRVFPGEPITLRKVRWAIDTKVQQGAFPMDEDLARLRSKLAAMPEAERWSRLTAILDWYDALARTIDEDGIAHDWQWNGAAWRCLIAEKRIDPEQYELLSLTFLRSRTAIGNSGRWQALAFERRAKIALGVGSVSGVRDGSCGTAVP